MKNFGFLVLIFILLAALFKWWGADLTNNVLGIALMVLLIALFSDLKEFNFWGLRGKKEIKNLEELKGKPGIAADAPKPNEEKVAEAEQQKNIIQLMDNSTGNFLSVAFEIERLLRVAATVILANSQQVPGNEEKLVKILKEKGLLADNGENQIKTIRWLRNMLVHGRSSEVTETTINQGMQLAWNFYTELNNWLKDPK